MIRPKESSEGLARFFDDSNPFWEEGREAGWLEGPITHYKASPFLVRNPDPKTGLPRDLKKGEGIMLAAFGSKISKNDWVQSFTSSDSDVLHDAHGVVSSTASNLNRGSEFDSRYKSLVATHHFKKFNQAKAFHDKFTSGAEPPFDQIHEILDNFESVPLEVIKETYYPEIGGDAASSRRGGNFERNEVTSSRTTENITDESTSVENASATDGRTTTRASVKTPRRPTATMQDVTRR